MTHFKTGAHTIEFKTTNYLKLSELPPAYENAIKPEGKRRYRLNVTKLPRMQEYNSPADTQKAINEAFTAIANEFSEYPTMTRVDYRLDDHEGTYADGLPLMTVLVNLIAYRSGIYDRRVFYTDGNGVTTSVRCMPDDKDKNTQYGAEYYDKPKQAKTDEYGNARFELRRLNMEGGSVQYVVKEWRDLLQSITKKEYLAMLEAHARSLHELRQDGETASAFIRRTRGKLIAYEEWSIMHRITGKRSNHYDNAAGLPKWGEVKTLIDAITAQLDEALSQPQSQTKTPPTQPKSITKHPNSGANELPF